MDSFRDKNCIVFIDYEFDSMKQLTEIYPTQTFPDGKMISLDRFSILDIHYAPNCHFPEHEDRYSRLSIILNGKLKETVGKVDEYATTASMVYKPKDVKHSNLFGPKGARIISIAFNDDQLLQDYRPAASNYWHWYHQFTHAPLAYSLLNTLWQETSIDAIEDCTFDLIANIHPSSKSISPLYNPSWLNKVVEYIHDDYSGNLRVKDLAAEVNVHPVYLSRVFRRKFGQSVKEYIHDVRIQHTVEKLVDTEIPIVQVALDHGFADQSHLNRVFKSRMGTTPWHYRRLIQML